MKSRNILNFKILIFEMNNSGDEEPRDNDPNPAPNQRQRSTLQPIDNSFIHHCMLTRTTEALINLFMNDNVFTMNLTQQHIDAQIVRIIILNRDQKATLYSVHRSRTQSVEVHFKRIY